jgi:hypothetical protein
MPNLVLVTIIQLQCQYLTQKRVVKTFSSNLARSSASLDSILLSKLQFYWIVSSRYNKTCICLEQSEPEPKVSWASCLSLISFGQYCNTTQYHRIHNSEGQPPKKKETNQRFSSTSAAHLLHSTISSRLWSLIVQEEIFRANDLKAIHLVSILPWIDLDICFVHEFELKHVQKLS